MQATCEKCGLEFFGAARLCKQHRKPTPRTWNCRMCGTSYAAANHTDGDARWPLCFTCDHYAVLLAREDGIIVDGHHYVIGPEGGSQFMRGFGGSKFRIRYFYDGSEIISTNVWHQGAFPEHFKPFYRNTAEFVR